MVTMVVRQLIIDHQTLILIDDHQECLYQRSCTALTTHAKVTFAFCPRIISPSVSHPPRVQSVRFVPVSSQP